MPEMKTLNGYEVVDAKAREDITDLRDGLPIKVSQLQNDSKFITREDIPDEYITESELDAKLDPMEASIAALEADCPETYFIDFSNATVSFQEATEHMNKFASKYVYGDNKEVIVMMKTPSSQYYYPAIMILYGNGYEILMTPLAINPNVIDAVPLDWEVIHLKLKDINKWEYCIFAEQEAKTLVSKEYVDKAIAKIEPPEADLTGYATEHYVDSTKLAILDIYNCNKLSESSWQLTDNVKNIIQRLFAGERFPITVAPYSHIQHIPSSISITSDEIRIELDTSHMWTNGQLTGLQTDTYVFTNTNGTIKLQITQPKLDVVDAYEYSQQLAALEARVAALEGGNA